MKVALCFIISYEHILHKEQLWIDWIKPNQDIINVYFHYKDINMIKSPWIKLYSIPPNFVKKTTYFQVVPAYMALLTYAFNHDIENLWFCLLTDSCVPIISPEKFRKLFFEHYQASIFKWRPAYWNLTIHRRANLRLLTKEYWLANDPWFTLSRLHVQKCILFLAGKNGIYNLVNEGGLANESIFAIILANIKEISYLRLQNNQERQLLHSISSKKNRFDINNIDNILKDSDIVVLQKNYDYLFWSIIATATVLISINVVKNN